MIQCARSGRLLVASWPSTRQNPVCWMQSSRSWQIPRIKISAPSHNSWVKRFQLLYGVNICTNTVQMPQHTRQLPIPQHTHWYTRTHCSARQAHKLHSITVMPQREVEMDGHRYERVQRPSFPWASVAEFPWADQFPVCHLGNRISQQQAGRKTSSNVNSEWIRQK